MIEINKDCLTFQEDLYQSEDRIRLQHHMLTFENLIVSADVKNALNHIDQNLVLG